MWNFKLEQQQQPGNVNQTEISKKERGERNSASVQCPCIVCFLIAMFLKCMFWGLLLEVPPKCFCTMHCNVQIIFIVWFMSAFWPGWHWWGWCSLAEIYLIRSAARRNIDVSLFDQNFLFQILQILHKIKVHQVESISFFDQFLKVNSWRWNAYDQNFLLQILEEEILI